jgi:hypothetical protein
MGLNRWGGNLLLVTVFAPPAQMSAAALGEQPTLSCTFAL